MSNKAHHTFETPEQLHAWLRVNHASETELWVRIFEKATLQPTVTWDDCVVGTIRWGWIDGLHRGKADQCRVGGDSQCNALICEVT